MTKFFVPPTKQGVVDWLVKFRKMKSSVLNKMKKKQLYAIYYKERILHG